MLIRYWSKVVERYVEYTKIPPKLKLFLWRACCGAFPTREALMSRKIIFQSWNSVESLCALVMFNGERYMEEDYALGSVEGPSVCFL